MTEPASANDPTPHPLRRGQDLLARLVGVAPAERAALVEALLQRSGMERVAYGLQLAIAAAIATLGLALNSAAVVIGAMLISPLMQPLIGFGAGLALGSPLLTFRSAIRTAGSVIAVVLAAAGMTLLLPFHDLNAELLARTSPTMLDLFVAGFCALAGVYTTVRPSGDTAAAAAGTAIGIALVPPLCTAGYGIGIDNEAMWRGALLLFTANFTAIMTVTALCFLLLGYGQVRLAELERGAIDAARDWIAPSIARLVDRLLGRRLGALFRIVFPVLLLAAISLPLYRALEQVKMQVTVRNHVEALLADLPAGVVRQSLDVRGDAVTLRVVMIGTPTEARALRDELRERIRPATDREPLVEVIAVADAAALDAVAARVDASPPPRDPGPVEEELADLAALEATLRAAVIDRWPADVAGTLARTALVLDEQDGLALEVTYVGAELGAPGVAVLERALGEDAGVPVTLAAIAIPPTVEVRDDDLAGWLVVSLEWMERAERAGLFTCVARPPEPVTPPRRRGAPAPVAPADPPDAWLRKALVAVVATSTRRTIVEGETWRVSFSQTACAAP
jgi:uncharacterized hydrophobic protein (TIGR00271 family)